MSLLALIKNLNIEVSRRSDLVLCVEQLHLFDHFAVQLLTTKKEEEEEGRGGGGGEKEKKPREREDRHQTHENDRNMKKEFENDWLEDTPLSREERGKSLTSQRFSRKRKTEGRSRRKVTP